MAKINVLDSSIFNLISAGEVVDKPMSVVKELVENAIDAGATVIDVSVKGGGTQSICVADNGSGIERDEIHKAFLPHATSKISKVEDLNSILTLGFRGEALASIAAVTKVTLTSRTENDELGYTVVYEAGECVSEYEKGAPKGVCIEVTELFSKIPARQKFLRSAVSEEADIANLMMRLILANPHISFKYQSETKKLLSTGENEKSALIAVYGNDILNNVEEVSLVMPDITIRGFIGKPSFSKHSRNYQTIVVNGRYVKNEDISYCIYLCYKDFLMSRQYPMFALYIDIPADMVDVNVHPNKMEVKFVQLDKIKKLIMSVVNAELNKIALAPKELVSEPPIAEEKTGRDFTFFNEKNELREERAFKSTYPATIHRFSFSDDDYAEVPKPNKLSVAENVTDVVHRENKDVDSFRPENGFNDDKLFAYDEFKPDFMTVGTLFSTYIVVEKDDNCYFIDQHAAHERLLYDKFVKELNAGRPIIQSLLIPYDFDLAADEGVLLEKNLDIFSECGFEIEKKGEGKYSVSAVPAIVSDMSFSEFLPIFFDTINGKALTKASLIKDVLAQSACKAAVKGNRILSGSEIDCLIEGINTLDALLCPHGRPIVVKVTKTEMDKWFKRK